MDIHLNQYFNNFWLGIKKILPWLMAIHVILLYTCTADHKQEQLQLNDIQIVGSHNSYKKAIDPGLMQLLHQEDSLLAVTLEYEHLPLKAQLNLGMRNLELDIFHDPEGGRFKGPLGIRAIPNASEYDSSKMKKPGFKLFHVQDIDFRSHHYLFSEALEEIKNWSDLHPEHIPLIITINLKDEVIERDGFVKPLTFGPEALDSVDQAILSVLDWSRLIYPDLVRGQSKTLEDAILSKGWPGLNEVRGKILFVLDASAVKNDLYRQGHPSLTGRVMFLNVRPGEPESAFHILNNPHLSYQQIQELVKRGYMVRTRADANTIEARSNDYSRWEKAIKSGAQVITTDYYRPSRFFESAYAVGFGNDTVYRINPVRVLK